MTAPVSLRLSNSMAEKVREKVEMRRRFDSAAASICGINLKRFLEDKNKESRQT